MLSSSSWSDMNTTTVSALQQYNTSTNFSNNESYYGTSPVFPPYIRTTATVICSFIMGIGVLGNIMVPIVIFKSKDMRNSTNVFLMNLSLADLMVLLVCTPTVLVEVNSPPETWVLGEEMCKAVPFIEMMVTHASVLTILAISFERYYAICEPLKAGYICTKTRAFLICLCAWFLAGLLTSPMLFISQYELAQYSDGSWVPACLTPADTLWKELFFYMSISVFFWVPLVVLLVLYSIIAVHLMADPGLKSSETFTHRARSQLILMLGTVVLSFFLCLMPFRVFLPWYISASAETIKNLGIEKYFNILYFCRTMSYVHSAINPILYNLMSTKFRDGFIKVCGMRRRRMLVHGRNWGQAMSSFSYSSSRRDRDHFGSVQYRYRGSSDFDRTSSFFREPRLLYRESSKRMISEANSNGECSPALIYSPGATPSGFQGEKVQDANPSDFTEGVSGPQEEPKEKQSTQSLLETHSPADFRSKIPKSKSDDGILRVNPWKMPPDRGKTLPALLDALLVPTSIKDSNEISLSVFPKVKAQVSENMTSSLDASLIQELGLEDSESSKVIRASGEVEENHVWL